MRVKLFLFEKVQAVTKNIRIKITKYVFVCVFRYLSQPEKRGQSNFSMLVRLFWPHNDGTFNNRVRRILDLYLVSTFLFHILAIEHRSINVTV